MRFLGINEGANSSVCVCEDGRVTFALQEERVSRSKEYIGFPHQALDFTLAHLGLAPADLDAVCLSNLSSPMMTRASFLKDYDINLKGIPELFAEGDMKAVAKRLFRKLPDGLRKASRKARYGGMNTAIDRALADHGLGAVPVKRYAHHSNHAASVYFGLRKNPHDPHLVLTLDGGGDEDCSRVYLAENGRMTLVAKTPFGHSLGQIYGRVTHLMGMTPHEHEYKLMGMAPYADDKYVGPALDILRGYLDLDPANPLVFKRRIPEDTTFIGPRLARDFRRVRFDSLAGAIQAFAEELVVKWVKAAIAKTGVRNVVAAGGVFMNVKANKLIAELPEVDYFDVFPSCGDETLPFGSVWQACFDADPAMNERIAFDDIYLGPEASFDLDEARQTFSDCLNFETVADPEDRIADLLAAGEVVARCSGRMEFGARALGNRSLLADPGDYRVIARINRMIKQRDFWMPFAPAATAETIDQFVRVPKSLPRPRVSPYMMHTFDTTERREEFPAGTQQYDQTARAQAVSKDLNPGFHGIIKKFAARSGKSIVLNTSFNLHGFPVVMGARDAMDVMCNSGIDYLFVDTLLVTKKA
ncbi:MAG: hypothetical protein CMM77_08405 [Rhodospirillaceae bacterium]|nr:hypothetical protein [Magnetovibrio sp.]MAY67135.1 hypothetical protein [Rhodospirillaceae bacterium]